MFDRSGSNIPQRFVEPNNRGLKDIVGLFPATKARVSSQHLTRQSHEPPLSELNQFVMCATVTRCRSIKETMHFVAVEAAAEFL